jgi:hypothetical protein
MPHLPRDNNFIYPRAGKQLRRERDKREQGVPSNVGRRTRAGSGAEEEGIQLVVEYRSTHDSS